MEDQIQVVTVRFNFGMVDLAERILDSEIVEFEDVGQDSRFIRCRIAQVDPDPHAAAGLSQAGSTRSTHSVAPSRGGRS